jgi:hypothetical protein
MMLIVFGIAIVAVALRIGMSKTHTCNCDRNAREFVRLYTDKTNRLNARIKELEKRGKDYLPPVTWSVK